MNKKSICVILVILVVIIAVIIVNLLSGKDTDSENAENGYSIKYDNVDVTPGTEFDEASISKEASVSEVESCAFDGMDIMYTYDEVEIVVTNLNEKNTVYSVYFINDGIETSEGVKITDSKEKMLETYGEGYEMSLDNKYTYVKDNVELSFTVQDDIIIGIEYILA